MEILVGLHFHGKNGDPFVRMGLAEDLHLSSQGQPVFFFRLVLC